MQKRTLFGGIFLLLMVGGVVLNMPDIIRYIKMKMM